MCGGPGHVVVHLGINILGQNGFQFGVAGEEIDLILLVLPSFFQLWNEYELRISLHVGQR